MITHLLNREDGSAMAGAIGETIETPRIVVTSNPDKGTLALYVAPEGEIGGKLVATLTREDALALSSILDGLVEGRW